MTLGGVRVSADRLLGGAGEAWAGLERSLDIVNIGLAAPGWAQLVHLLGAQLTWIAAVITVVSTLERKPD